MSDHGVTRACGVRKSARVMPHEMKRAIYQQTDGFCAGLGNRLVVDTCRM